MQTFKTFLLLLLSFFYIATGHADDTLFKMDQDLVIKFKENKVRLIVMRQAEGNNNTKKIITSSRSPGFCLTLKGVTEIGSLVPFFLKQNIFKIFTSPLYRSLQSTQIFGGGLKLPVYNLIVDERLEIQKFGIYERYKYVVYNALFPTVADMLEADLDGMESGADVYKRTQAFLWHIANNVSNKTILVITHAFNFCHISKCLTDDYGNLPYPASYIIYDFTEI